MRDSDNGVYISWFSEMNLTPHALLDLTEATQRYTEAHRRGASSQSAPCGPRGWLAGLVLSGHIEEGADVWGLCSGFGYLRQGGAEEGPVSAVTEGQGSKTPITLVLHFVPFLWHHSTPKPCKRWGVRIISESLEKEILRKPERERQGSSVLSLLGLEEEGRKKEGPKAGYILIP